MLRFALLVAAGVCGLAEPAPMHTAAPAYAQEAAPAPPAVLAVLEAMQSAVRAGDADAYLKQVAAKDAFFLQEQRCWAAELKKANPERFELELKDAKLNPAGDELHGDLTLRWKFTGGRDRTLRYPAIFRLEDDGWKFAGERWRVVEGPGFKVKYLGDAEAEAKAIAEILPEVRDRVFQEFAEPVARHVEVKFYPSMPHIQQSIHLNYADAIGGWNEPGEAIKMVKLAFLSSDPKQKKMILAHEMGHVATFALGPKAKDIPWWVQEGVAEAAAEPFYDKRRVSTAMMKLFVAGKSVKDWGVMREYTPESMKLAGQVYNQGHHLIAYLTDRFGLAQRNAWLRAMAAGQTLDQATQAVLGLPFGKLDEEWRAALKADPELILPKKKR